jgi:hypothetical protein
MRVELDQEKCGSLPNRSITAPHTLQKQAPSCPICRASLSEGAPLIPNFAVDSAVEKHVQALRTNGVEGWENSGAKLTEWQARKA